VAHFRSARAHENLSDSRHRLHPSIPSSGKTEDEMLSQAKKIADRRDAIQLRTNGGSQHPE
jgi:hypothetical protein